MFKRKKVIPLGPSDPVLEVDIYQSFMYEGTPHFFAQQGDETYFVPAAVSFPANVVDNRYPSELMYFVNFQPHREMPAFIRILIKLPGNIYQPLGLLELGEVYVSVFNKALELLNIKPINIEALGYDKETGRLKEIPKEAAQFTNTRSRILNS